MRKSLCLLLLAAACSRSSDAPPTVLAAATVGPAGGELTVTSGIQAGLRLTVPPGAVTTEVELRILDVPFVLPPGGVPVTAASPGDPVRIEPVDLYLDQPATLHLPYVVQALQDIAPGNVRVRQSRDGSDIQRDPTVVDVTDGFVELATRTFGQYQVVRGPVVGSVAAYRPLPADPVTLTDGFSFAVEEIPTTSPFAATADARWHISGPGFDELWYFHGGELIGRESAADWRETWNVPYDVWQNPQQMQAYGLTTSMQVQAPISVPPLGGSMTVSGTWNFSEPRPVGTALAYDVVWLQVSLAWQRSDIGTGQRSYALWLAPEHGLLALSIDGVMHERTQP